MNPAKNRQPVRGPDTACAVAGIPPEAALQDERCELLILRGLLNCGQETAPLLREVGLETADLYHDRHQKLFDVLMYLATGGPSGPYEAFCELRFRGERLDFPTGGLMARWILDVYSMEYWIPELFKHWSDPIMTVRGQSNSSWVACCAAKKVRHLARRRYVIHAAREAISLAVKPTGGDLETGLAGDNLEAL